MFGLERHAAALGTPGAGFHTHVLGVAMFDVVAVVAAAALLGGIKGPRIFAGWLVGLFLLGICAHRVFGVRTTVDRILFR